jgi:hypothetical protein
MMARRSSHRDDDGRVGADGDGRVGADGVGGDELSPQELSALDADDLLLDALGRGEPVTGGDELAALLGAWRAEMDTEPLPRIDLGAIVAAAGDLGAEPAVGGPDFLGDLGGAPGAGSPDEVRVRPAAIGRAASGPPGPGPAGTGPADGRPARNRSGRARRVPRGLRLGLAALLLIAAAGGLSVTANAAGPDGPLWSVVRLVDPGRADLREAQDAVAKAEKAAAEHRYADAWELVDKADGLVARVRDPQQQAELRGRLEAVRRSLPARVSGTAPSTVPGLGASTAPGAPVPTGAPGQTGGAGQQGGGPGGGSTPGQTAPGLLPGLPPLLPSPTSSPPPLLPTCILPSILPTGPLLPGLPPVCH